jgi:hypothetical protein
MAKASEETTRAQKRTYRPPTLRTFGNVQQITQAQRVPGGKPDNFMEQKTGIVGSV